MSLNLSTTSLSPRRFQSGLVALLTLISIPLWGNTAHAADKWSLSPYLRVDSVHSDIKNNDGTLKDDVNTFDVEIIGQETSQYQFGVGVKITDYLRSDVTISKL